MAANGKTPTAWVVGRIAASVHLAVAAISVPILIIQFTKGEDRWFVERYPNGGTLSGIIAVVCFLITGIFAMTVFFVGEKTSKWSRYARKIFFVLLIVTFIHYAITIILRLLDLARAMDNYWKTTASDYYYYAYKGSTYASLNAEVLDDTVISLVCFFFFVFVGIIESVVLCLLPSNYGICNCWKKNKDSQPVPA